jgi:hypothetical protein
VLSETGAEAAVVDGLLQVERVASIDVNDIRILYGGKEVERWSDGGDEIKAKRSGERGREEEDLESSRGAGRAVQGEL